MGHRDIWSEALGWKNLIFIHRWKIDITVCVYYCSVRQAREDRRIFAFQLSKESNEQRALLGDRPGRVKVLFQFKSIGALSLIVIRLLCLLWSNAVSTTLCKVKDLFYCFTSTCHYRVCLHLHIIYSFIRQIFIEQLLLPGSLLSAGHLDELALKVLTGLWVHRLVNKFQTSMITMVGEEWGTYSTAAYSMINSLWHDIQTWIWMVNRGFSRQTKYGGSKNGIQKGTGTRENMPPWELCAM